MFAAPGQSTEAPEGFNMLRGLVDNELEEAYIPATDPQLSMVPLS